MCHIYTITANCGKATNFPHLLLGGRSCKLFTVVLAVFVKAILAFVKIFTYWTSIKWSLSINLHVTYRTPITDSSFGSQHQIWTARPTIMAWVLVRAFQFAIPAFRETTKLAKEENFNRGDLSQA
eukprot:TRINITY_DN5287_c0_g1_i1.p2 TRINITY_DN5287_c0_g1~~TRINITY_DN5287_c0_g1_i1.p2  ORF type:complete len:125 (+),score=1.38 TRINITY_DN5287_c0_g1_i1:162-536(+)